MVTMASFCVCLTLIYLGKKIITRLDFFCELEIHKSANPFEAL